MFKRVRFHLRKLSRRALNDIYKNGHQIPEREALTDALAAYVHAELTKVIRYREPGEPRTGREGFRYLDGDDAVRRVAASAANYALRKWDADYIEEMIRRGGKGGAISKRKPAWTDADLDALARLKGETVAQQAAELSRSPRTVERMRRALRDRTTASAAPPHTPATVTAAHAQLTRRQEAAEERRDSAEAQRVAFARFEAQQAAERQEHVERLARYAHYAAHPAARDIPATEDLDALLR